MNIWINAMVIFNIVKRYKNVSINSQFGVRKRTLMSKHFEEGLQFQALKTLLLLIKMEAKINIY